MPTFPDETQTPDPPGFTGEGRGGSQLAVSSQQHSSQQNKYKSLFIAVHLCHIELQV